MKLYDGGMAIGLVFLIIVLSAMIVGHKFEPEHKLHEKAKKEYKEKKAQENYEVI